MTAFGHRALRCGYPKLQRQLDPLPHNTHVYTSVVYKSKEEILEKKFTKDWILETSTSKRHLLL